MVKKFTFIAFLYVLLPLQAFSLSRGFPQALSYKGAIKPSNRTQSQLNQAVIDFYNGWKDDYLHVAGSTPGGYYVYTPDATGRTVSEAHGYGMIITAIMGGADVDAKKYFDGMYMFFRDHTSTDSDDLMSWTVSGTSSSEYAKKNDTATDGDLDIAFALLLAHDQWGSDGAIDYLAEAKKVIAAIKKHEMGAESKRPLLGSWVDPYGDYYDQWGSRSSDWMPDHFRAFASVTSDNFWNAAVDTVYSVWKVVANSTTGLVPDFVEGVNPSPVTGEYLEDPTTDGNYGANACRDPWRIATDYALYGSSDAKNVLKKMMDWIINDANNDPEKIKNGYYLKGNKIEGGYPYGFYLAPIVAGSIIDSSYQSFLDAGWSILEGYESSSGSYYGHTLTLLSMILISGNYWEPGQLSAISDKYSKNNDKMKMQISITNGGFTIKSKYNTGKISIFDINGRLLMTSVFSDLNSGKYLKLSQYGKGVLLVRFESPSGIINRKISIVK